MPKLRRLSAQEIIAIFNRLGFEIISQKGSHIKLRRFGETGKETLTIPNHKQLDLGIFIDECIYIYISIDISIDI